MTGHVLHRRPHTADLLDFELDHIMHSQKADEERHPLQIIAMSLGRRLSLHNLRLTEPEPTSDAEHHSGVVVVMFARGYK